MALTLALFSFVNAAHNDVTDVDELLVATKTTGVVAECEAEAPKKAVAVEKVLHLKESVAVSQSSGDHAKRKKDLKKAFEDMGSACKNVRGAVWDYTTSGTLVSDLKDAHDWVLSEENLKKANHYKDRAYGLCHTVGVTVPTWALAAAAAIFADSVSTEFVCASEIYALALGGTLCYVASRFNPFSSKRQACDPRAEHCKEELMRLLALKAMLENQRKVDDSSSDDEDGIKKDEHAHNQHDESTAEKLGDAFAEALLKEKEDASPEVESEAEAEKKHESSHH